MQSIIFDLIIIGAGPAGLTAGIYAGRYKLNCLIIGKLPGGTAGTAYDICNFPSYKKISGMKLMLKIIKQVKNFGIEIKQEIVEDIKKNENIFEINTARNKYLCKKLIIATGTEKTKMELKKEKEFLGKGVSYCATCDSEFCREKTVAVIGGGNAAIADALLLSRYARKVYLIYRGKNLTRVENMQNDDLKENKNIEILLNTNVKKLIGTSKLEEIEIETKGKNKILKLDGIFIQIGNTPNIKLAQKLGLKLEKGEIAVNKRQKTNIKGVFAAGDVTNVPFKQIITACSGGAIAVNNIYKEIVCER